ncbi:hypothetical protein D3C77_652350 [compost metagenome]
MLARLMARLAVDVAQPALMHSIVKQLSFDIKVMAQVKRKRRLFVGAFSRFDRL